MIDRNIISLLQISTFLFSFFHLINSTLIAENKNLLTFSQEFKSEIKSIQNLPWSFKSIDYKSYNFTDPGQGLITLSNFRLTDSLFKSDSLSISIDNNNNFILSDNKSGTFFNRFYFDYQTSKSKNSGIFILSTTQVKLTKRYTTEDSLIKQNVTFGFDLQISDINLADVKITDLATSALNEFLLKSMYNLIKSYMAKDFNDFYEKLNKKNAEKKYQFPLVINYPNITINVDLSFDKIPKIASPLTNDLILSRAGIVNGIPHNDTLPKFKYSKLENSSQVAMSRIIMYDILNIMTDKGVFNYTVNTQNLYHESMFGLTINDLSDIIPDISDKYPRKDEITIFNIIRSINYDENVKENFIFDLVVETYVINVVSDKIIFNFTQNLNVELKSLIMDNSINFSVDSVRLTSVKVLSEEYYLVNLGILKKYLDNYYKLYFVKNKKFDILKNSINLSFYTDKIKEVGFTEYGLNLVVDLKKAYLFTETIKKQALKFLEKK